MSPSDNFSVILKNNVIEKLVCEYRKQLFKLLVGACTGCPDESCPK
jgi:hypothetical protein